MTVLRQMAAMYADMSSVWLMMVSSMAFVFSADHVSPFFYLCSFQSPQVDQSVPDVAQVALSVHIEADPQFYEPGHFYNGRETTLADQWRIEKFR